MDVHRLGMITIFRVLLCYHMVVVDVVQVTVECGTLRGSQGVHLSRFTIVSSPKYTVIRFDALYFEDG
jgi:hypothetical protein